MFTHQRHHATLNTCCQAGSGSHLLLGDSSADPARYIRSNQRAHELSVLMTRSDVREPTGWISCQARPARIPLEVRCFLRIYEHVSDTYR